MQILTGLFDHNVLQRTARNLSNAPITGTTDAAGKLVAIARKGTRPVGKAVVIGKSSAGKFAGTLKHLPTGGPYTVELSIVDAKGKSLDRIIVKDVLVGDVWIAAGQSNMQGCGLIDSSCKSDPLVRAFYMDDHWAVAKDPIHDLGTAVDFFHNNGNRMPPAKNPATGAGPAIAFAIDMRRRENVPQGILACAHGGTSMTQWDPSLIDQGGKSLFGATARRVHKNGGSFAGVIWYQGESDTHPAAVALFTDRMKKLVAAFRKLARDPKLPFAMVQLSRFAVTVDPVNWNAIREQQRHLPSLIKNVATVPAIDLQLDDVIHIGSDSMETLGTRLAGAIDNLRRGTKAGKPPITLKKISFGIVPPQRTPAITIEFDNVEGSLRSIGPASGVFVRDGSSPIEVYRIRLDGNKVIVNTDIPPQSQTQNLRVSYGTGMNPYCNITDSANRSLPVFAEQFIGNPRAVSPWVTTVRVSDILPGAGKLHDLSYPADLASLNLTPRKFAGSFMDRHTETENPATPQDAVHYYAFTFTVEEPMKLALLLGYDGPVKAWLDTKQVLHDPAGTNPANMDTKSYKFDATPGEHHVLIALGTNNRKAWGVFARFERLGLSAQAIREQQFKMPVVIG